MERQRNGNEAIFPLIIFSKRKVQDGKIKRITKQANYK